MSDYDLVLPDRTRVPVAGTMTIGRGTSCAIRLDDGAVSRRHAVLRASERGVVIEDAGSRSGTWVDGARVVAPTVLRDGSALRVGDQQLVLERRRAANESGMTRVVPLGASAQLRAVGLPVPASRGPRLRSGYAVKRLAAGEGEQRWVLRDLRADRFVRLRGEGELLELVDGQHTVAELMEIAGDRFGAEGPALVMGLLSELAERGLLAEEDDDAGDPGAAPAAPTAAPAAAPRRGRLLQARTWAWSGADAFFAALYARARWLLSPPFLAAVATLAVTGVAAFGFLVARRYGTPFVVASHIGLGGIVFLIGRFAVAALHETAHGLVMASFGRRVGKAGFKVVLIFPYVFVDTSEAWFLPRRRRIAVSAAGPVSDAALGGLFSWCCLLLAPGPVRDICFQLAFGAYLGALVNLNPMVERDGYHILADVLGEPALRRKARAELRRVLGRRDGTPVSPVLVRYALAGLAWSLVAGALTIAMSLRYAPALEALLPAPVAWTMLFMIWAAALSPAVVTLGGPLLDRRSAHGRT